MRINRTNTQVYRGQVIALPESNSLLSNMDHSPFPPQVAPLQYKTIVVDFSDLAFGAYDRNGTLQHWGPISGGKAYCADVGRGCNTPKGTYTIYRKLGADCKSSKFPVGKGGAPMPYCMFFKGGFALHGSPNVPGYNDSHGCIRLYKDDARWLNQDFTNGANVRVIIRQ
jgi:L,D-transpeptidase ErfK/SrfK